ncbi:hypothetical protein RYX36_013430, partial [Vicia faba]
VHPPCHHDSLIIIENPIHPKPSSSIKRIGFISKSKTLFPSKLPNPSNFMASSLRYRFSRAPTKPQLLEIDTSSTSLSSEEATHKDRRRESIILDFVNHCQSRIGRTPIETTLPQVNNTLEHPQNPIHPKPSSSIKRAGFISKSKTLFPSKLPNPSNFMASSLRYRSSRAATKPQLLEIDTSSTSLSSEGEHEMTLKLFDDLIHRIIFSPTPPNPIQIRRTPFLFMSDGME